MLIASSARGAEVYEIRHRDRGDLVPLGGPALDELALGLRGLAALAGHDEEKLPMSTPARHQAVRREQVRQRAGQRVALRRLRRLVEIGADGEAEDGTGRAHPQEHPSTSTTAGRRPAR